MKVICRVCGKEFNKKPYECKTNPTHYCSTECLNQMRRQTFLDNFESAQHGKWKLLEYKDKNNVMVQCTTCGTIKTVDSTQAVRVKGCNVCRARETELRRAERELINNQLRDIKAKRKELAKIESRLEKAYEKACKKAKQREVTAEKQRQYMKLHELKRTNRIKNNGIVDKDITLKKLYQRDKGVCSLCGGKCDYEDYKVTSAGYFIAGLNYPSIDHVIPLSKGGTHTWDNVKLAHFLCNSKKGNGDRQPRAS